MYTIYIYRTYTVFYFIRDNLSFKINKINSKMFIMGIFRGKILHANCILHRNPMWQGNIRRHQEIQTMKLNKTNLVALDVQSTWNQYRATK